MTKHKLLFLLLVLLLGLGMGAVLNSSAAFAGQAKGSQGWTFACAADNDLYRVITAGGTSCRRFKTAAEAVQAAAEGSGVLILADGYPDHPTIMKPAVFEEAARKRLRLYMEYPEWLPDMEIGPPKTVKYERGVVTSTFFGEALRPMRIVLVSSCRYLPMRTRESHLVLAKVAGVDTAVYGLKDTPAAPLLFDHPRGHLLVATTKLSHFVTGRYLPADAWRTIWEKILQRLQPDGPKVELRWTPTVRPSFGPAEKLPADAEKQALSRSADWMVRSRVLRHPNWPGEALDRSLRYNTVRDMPRPEWPSGDGSFGLLEGFSSTIRPDGSQPMRYAVRNDCTTEAALLLACDAAVNSRPRNARVAGNLLDYIFGKSGLAAGPRADPRSPSYGLIGWALDSPGSYWGDDNARALLAVGAVAALAGEKRWDEPTCRCLLANFRTTGISGFRESCIHETSLQKNGWKHYWAARRVHYSPHYQSWLWACNFWAYRQTRFEPLLARSKAGLRAMMQAYPARWDWCLRSGTIERARLLLPLAWLVRVEDTPEHRRWLRTMATDLLALQDASGAIREIIGDGGVGLPSNAAYGTGEISLIQVNGDPVCDMLYSCNFALIGLHEAAAATGDPFYAQAEDKLARFLCRIQVRSEAHPELDGAWYRAFDFRRWEYWASSADWEWGPWCTETGWCQPWIAGTLALRQQKTSLWDLVQQVDLKKHFDRLRPNMLPDEDLAVAKPQLIRHAALGKPVHLTTLPDPRYPAFGEVSLTDGEVAGNDFLAPEWLGFHGEDLEAVIDLGAATEIRSVNLRCLQNTQLGIYLPARVEVALSQDGKNYQAGPVVKNDMSLKEPGPLVRPFRMEMKTQNARFVKVRAVNIREIPASQSGAGKKAWLFVDEILINQ